MEKLKDMDLKELKSQAYDCMAMIEFYQRKLADLNNQITQKVQEDNSLTENNAK